MSTNDRPSDVHGALSVIVERHLAGMVGEAIRMDPATGNIRDRDADRIDSILPAWVRVDRSIPITDGTVRLILIEPP